MDGVNAPFRFMSEQLGDWEPLAVGESKAGESTSLGGVEGSGDRVK